jgi:hypothetical protein
MKMRDLGLTYEQALHGIQSAVAFEMEQNGIGCTGEAARMMKHMRTAIDATKAEIAGLVGLMISKGLITLPEYIEVMRRSLNEELARYEQYAREAYGLPEEIRFR